MAYKTMTQRFLHEAGSEIKRKEPRIVGHTRRKFGKETAEKQRKAILLSKARARGARIPYKPSSRKRRRRDKIAEALV